MSGAGPPDGRPAGPPGRATWGPAQYLAACAAVLLAYEAWTLAAWVADGPFQVTADRDRGSTSWYAARVLEVVVLASVAGFVVKAVRDHRREGRLGVDSLLIIGMFSAAFWDPIYNWLTPAWLYTSNFLNVNDWFAHAPGIVNPDAGRMPWPIVIVLVGYPLWGVGFAILTNVVMRAAQTRRPALSRARLAGVGLAVSVGLTWASFALFKAFGLMAAPGFRFGVLGDSDIFFAGLSGGIVFWALACLRFFRDDRGRTLFELGSRGGVTSVLAAVAACQLLVILGWGLLTVPFTLHSSPYPRLPAHLVNGLCDTPGTHGTAYGPCPGAPGFRLPVR
jgi:hypothetical protein